MAAATNDFILDMLGRIQSNVSETKADVRKSRIGLGSIETQTAHLQMQLADISVRMDRRDDMMERVMRRLEMTEHQS